MEMIIGFIGVIFFMFVIFSLGGLWRRDNGILLTISFSIMLISTACSHNQVAPENHIEKNKQQEEKEEKLPMEKVEEAPKTEKATPDKIKSAVFETLGFNSIEGEQKISEIVIDNEDKIIIKFIPDANVSENLLSFSIQKDIANILLGIKNSNVTVKSVQLISSQPTTHQTGNTAHKEIVNVTYNKETIDKIDFESFNTDNILSMADTVTYLEPAIK